MVIRVNDEKENLVTIVEVSTVEYENSERYFKVFDISGESAIITKY